VWVSVESLKVNYADLNPESCFLLSMHSRMESPTPHACSRDMRYACIYCLLVMMAEDTIETSSEAPIIVIQNYNQDLIDPIAKGSGYLSGND